MTAKKVSGLRPTAEVSNNPKHRIGITKAPLTLNPVVAAIEQSLAHYDGADKYGAFNWRVEKVNMRIYIEAAKRHLDCLLEGEDYADDSGVHHCGHVMACMAIILDAQSLGQLIDDRPLPGAATTAFARAKDWLHTRISKADSAVSRSAVRGTIDALNDAFNRNLAKRTEA